MEPYIESVLSTILKFNGVMSERRLNEFELLYYEQACRTTQAYLKMLETVYLRSLREMESESET